VDGFGVATDRQFFQDRIRRGRRRAWLNLPITPIFFGILIIVAAFGIRETGVASLLLDSPAPIVGSVSARSFDLCTRAPRVTCVVDGDTFWLDGTKIRIADINTPETGKPQCAAEAILGRRATERLVELLSGGSLDLRAADRDEDQYGRKLRIVERDGRSVGQVLVSEGLAHEWRGRRESWC
jgi:endonuclease YncB( thermonuclease family)